MFDRFKKGELHPADRTFEDEEDRIQSEGTKLGTIPGENDDVETDET